MVQWKIRSRKESLKAQPASLARIHHVVVRECLVPRVPLDAEREIAAPDGRADAVANLCSGHVVVVTLVIARDMRLDMRNNRRKYIERAAVLGKKDLNARTGGLESLYKDEAVFMGNDHGIRSGPDGLKIRSPIQSLSSNSTSLAFQATNMRGSPSGFGVALNRSLCSPGGNSMSSAKGPRMAGGRHS